MRHPTAGPTFLITAPEIATGEALDALAPLRLATWEGKPATQATEVRLATERRRLLVSFRCVFDRLDLDPSLPGDRSAMGLWQHDVVEVFVSDRPEGLPYREIEASPLGQWLALAFDAPRVAAKRPFHFRPGVAARIGAGRFDVTLALELALLRSRPAPSPAGAARPAVETWRIGLFRIHGTAPDREHQALLPTGTPEPDFHQPSRWATLELAR